MSLTGKTVVVGVSGGIAAYKAVEVVSRLRKLGADVYVIMTQAATKFVAPLTFHSLSQHPVLVELLEEPKMWNVEHIALARRTDLLIIAPATAGTIGKLANGLADDFLSTFVLALRCPVLVAPAMNPNMYTHPGVQRNLGRLSEFGYRLMEPGTGFLAEGGEGIGRLPEPVDIVSEALRLLQPRMDLRGRRILVTAGGTQEPIDPVRVISNRSSGKMGYALAEAARDRGADVVLVTCPTHLTPPAGVELVRVRTASELRDAVLARFESLDAVLMAAAVADFRPAEAAERKIKKTDGDDRLVLELVKNPDILAELGSRKRGQILVGFAAETHDGERHAMKKLASKNSDLVVLNDVSAEGAGFEVDTNIVTIFAKTAEPERVPLAPKREIADRILDRVSSLLPARGDRGAQP